MSKLFKKSLFLVVSLVCFSFFVPSFVQATDTRCWQKEACEADGGIFYSPNTETIAACKTDKDAAGKEIGFCTAVGSAKTNVGFGGEGEGKKDFANFGAFIQWIYRYGVVVAGVLAVVMVMVAGLQWVTSAGSPERITQAKKRIGNALMGLFVALISYFILNTVNPYLVNFRLPQVWKINSIGIVAPYCDEIEGGKKLSETQNGQFTIEPKDGVCGKEYFVEDGGESTCKGTACDGRKGCVPFQVVAGQKVDQAQCTEDLLTIYFKLDSSSKSMFSEENVIDHGIGTFTSMFFGNVNQPDWLDEEPSIVVFCAKGSELEVDLWADVSSVVEYKKITKDQSGNKLVYNDYLVTYNLKTIDQANGGVYKCDYPTKDGKSKPTGFYISDEIDRDVVGDDWNMYLASVRNTRDRLVATRYGGAKSDAWPFPFFIFKDKNQFFQLNLTGEMLNNIEADAKENSKPEEGSLSGAFTYEIWEETLKFWGELIF